MVQHGKLELLGNRKDGKRIAETRYIFTAHLLDNEFHPCSSRYAKVQPER